MRFRDRELGAGEALGRAIHRPTTSRYADRPGPARGLSFVEQQPQHQCRRNGWVGDKGSDRRYVMVSVLVAARTFLLERCLCPWERAKWLANRKLREEAVWHARQVGAEPGCLRGGHLPSRQLLGHRSREVRAAIHRVRCRRSDPVDLRVALARLLSVPAEAAARARVGARPTDDLRGGWRSDMYRRIDAVHCRVCVGLHHPRGSVAVTPPAASATVSSSQATSASTSRSAERRCSHASHSRECSPSSCPACREVRSRATASRVHCWRPRAA
jgi:hypothetical protein